MSTGVYICGVFPLTFFLIVSFMNVRETSTKAEYIRTIAKLMGIPEFSTQVKQMKFLGKKFKNMTKFERSIYKISVCIIQYQLYLPSIQRIPRRAHMSSDSSINSSGFSSTVSSTSSTSRSLPVDLNREEMESASTSSTSSNESESVQITILEEDVSGDDEEAEEETNEVEINCEDEDEGEGEEEEREKETMSIVFIKPFFKKNLTMLMEKMSEVIDHVFESANSCGGHINDIEHGNMNIICSFRDSAGSDEKSCLSALEAVRKIKGGRIAEYFDFQVFIFTDDLCSNNLECGSIYKKFSVFLTNPIRTILDDEVNKVSMDHPVANNEGKFIVLADERSERYIRSRSETEQVNVVSETRDNVRYLHPVYEVFVDRNGIASTGSDLEEKRLKTQFWSELGISCYVNMKEITRRINDEKTRRNFEIIVEKYYGDVF